MSPGGDGPPTGEPPNQTSPAWSNRPGDQSISPPAPRPLMNRFPPCAGEGYPDWRAGGRGRGCQARYSTNTGVVGAGISAALPMGVHLSRTIDHTSWDERLSRVTVKSPPSFQGWGCRSGLTILVAGSQESLSTSSGKYNVVCCTCVFDGMGRFRATGPGAKAAGEKYD
jgi:hypothetical protein